MCSPINHALFFLEVFYYSLLKIYVFKMFLFYIKFYYKFVTGSYLKSYRSNNQCHPQNERSFSELGRSLNTLGSNFEPKHVFRPVVWRSLKLFQRFRWSPILVDLLPIVRGIVTRVTANYQGYRIFLNEILPFHSLA